MDYRLLFLQTPKQKQDPARNGIAIFCMIFLFMNYALTYIIAEIYDLEEEMNITKDKQQINKDNI